MIRIWPRKGPEVQTGRKRTLNTGNGNKNNSSNNKNKRTGSNDNKSRRQNNKGGSLDSRYQQQQQQQQQQKHQQQHVLVPIVSPQPKESTQKDATAKGNLGTVYNIYSELWDFPQKTVF